MRRALAAAICIALAASVAAQQTPPTPPRDAPRAAAGVASVSGRVTDTETGQPIRRIRVELSRATFADEPRVFHGITDADGRYDIPYVPAGEYHATASVDEFGAGYLSRTFGADDTAVVPRRPALSLRPGERRADLDFALARTYAIEGRVTNEFGEPLADVAVIAEGAGGPAFFMGRPMTTDDRGQFRLWGFRPGSWRVCAKPSNREAAAGGDVHQRYVKTCYPPEGSGKAAGIAVGRADVTGVVIHMQRERAFTISGHVVDETGAPVEKASVEVQRVERDTFRFGPHTVEASRGAFVAQGLTPGDYVVRAIVRQPPSQDPQLFDGPVLLGIEPVRIEGSDIGGIVVTATRGVTVRGRVAFDGEPKPDLRRSEVRIGARRGGDATEIWQNVDVPSPAFVREDLTFELARIRGPVVVQVMNPPVGWLVRSVRHADVDITSIPTDFGRAGAPRDVDIVLTNRLARVRLRAVDESGAPLRAAVFVLPADTARRRPGSFFPRPVDDAGLSSEIPTLPGDYVVFALPLDSIVVGDPIRNAEAVSEAAVRGQRVTLKEGDSITIDVRVQKVST